MIAETLVVAAEQGGIDGLFDAMGPITGEQHVEQLAQEGVHLVISDGQPATRQRILVLDCGGSVVGELAGEQAHPGQDGPHLTCCHGVRMLAQRHDGDMPGEGAHPLHLAQRPQDRNHHPQLPGHRGL